MRNKDQLYTVNAVTPGNGEALIVSPLGGLDPPAAGPDLRGLRPNRSIPFWRDRVGHEHR